MFGYVVCNQQELKLKEYDLYRSYYCGFCHVLKEKYGRIGQATLSYDMTFLILLLSGLYDTDTTSGEDHCVIHPLTKHAVSYNAFTEYAADMNVILSYYSCLDDWEDEKKFHKLLLSRMLKGKEAAAGETYGHKEAVIKDRLMKLSECEKAGSPDIDTVSGFFGDILAEICAPREDEWEESLRRLGFFLGKFIYIMDAYEDMEKDEKSGSYNPLLIRRRTVQDQRDPEEDDSGEFEQYCLQIMTMMMAECCKTFETLPVVENANILRNILYSGVWSRYGDLQKKKSESKI